MESDDLKCPFIMVKRNRFRSLQPYYFTIIYSYYLLILDHLKSGIVQIMTLINHEMNHSLQYSFTRMQISQK